jgi:ribosome-binding protein aMBF1 (putative translation factor)
MKAISKLHTQWLKRPRYKKNVTDTQAEYELAQKVIRARINSGLSQKTIAKKKWESLFRHFSELKVVPIEHQSIRLSNLR